ncbi:DUF3489 domain-containing protein [uncultured Aquabacterium sp.]|uniref:DUF3489 domain-containing protein n=1 Tax=uncultured Aquabacterium sp. TaxID=158753 RepID=UPI0025DF24C0|nr:DUF3489 domain-containing protein [uncultured Aquabacterium sp.]
MTMKLTDTQALILNTAIQSSGGQLSWFPDNLKGGARDKVLGSLLRQGLIQIDGESHRVTDLAYETLGLAVPPALAEPIKAAPRTRENTKQAQIIAMLQRPEGATISQIVEATGWQPHTVRGTFAGAFKKKLGLTLSSSKDEHDQRVYRVA